jgi:hypothetical protein
MQKEEKLVTNLRANSSMGFASQTSKTTTNFYNSKNENKTSIFAEKRGSMQDMGQNSYF